MSTAPAVPFTKVDRQRGIYVIAQGYNTTLNFTVSLMAPWPEYDVVLAVQSTTGSPGPGLLFVAPTEYLRLSPAVLTGGLAIIPFGPGNTSRWGVRYHIKSLVVTVQVICNTCSSSNYYTIDLYLSEGT
jgi:hypothetical protein